jgi:flavin-dependent dehydrogenase
MTNAASYDVVVVGAGPAGAATALALSQLELRVALLDRAHRPGERWGEALSPAAQNALRALGLWDDFLREPHRRFHEIHSAWGGTTIARSLDQHGLGPGFQLDRPRFERLVQRHAEQSGARLLLGAHLRGFEWLDAQTCRLWIARQGERLSIHAKYLVDATGRRAWLSRRLGAERAESDRLLAVTRRFVDAKQDSRILCEAADGGWWYSGPAVGDGLVASFFTDADGPLARAAQPQVWRAALDSAPATRARLGDAQPSEPLVARASPGFTAWSPRSRCLPVGDAALSLDPIAATGLTAALCSALQAARVISRCLAGQGDAADDYRRDLTNLYREHQRLRQGIYARESRRRATLFWQRSRVEGRRFG